MGTFGISTSLDVLYSARGWRLVAYFAHALAADTSIPGLALNEVEGNQNEATGRSVTIGVL